MRDLQELSELAGLKFFDYQVEVLQAEESQDPLTQRVCLYYKTGAGKSITSLALLAQKGYTETVVIAPPSTYDTWISSGQKFGITCHMMSHAKFRMKDTKLKRDVPVIADEFHLFGGHGGKGWAKLDRLAAGIRAPVILASATPNYNDAERVYCIQHILDPLSCRGGYIEFLYRNCETEQNPFGKEPIVTGFTNFSSAAEYLAALPKVYYVEDDVSYTIEEFDYLVPRWQELNEYGYDMRTHRIMASGIEEKHRRIFNALVGFDGKIFPEVYDELISLTTGATGPVLIYTDHSTVADALGESLHHHKVKHAVVTGSTPAKKKAAYIDAFRDGVLDVLVGTASLATGTDGFDKVCDMLIIFDDTEDDAKRRQLIGRIMPRGADSDASKKQVIRFNLIPS